MVVATFWSSYIAAYKLYKYFFGTDSVAVGKRILQQSLKKNKLRENVKTERRGMNAITTSAGKDDRAPVELEPTTTIAHEISVDMKTVHASVPDSFNVLEVQTVGECVPVSSYEVESVTAVKDIPFEEETVTGCAYESTLEVETVHASVPETSVKITEGVTVVKEIAFEEETPSGCDHESTLEVETITLIVPESSVEIIEDVTAVKEIPFEEQTLTGCVHEFTLELETVTPVVLESSDEIFESVTAVKDIPFEEEALTGYAHEFTLELETATEFAPQFSVEIFERITAVKEIRFEEEMHRAVAQESPANVNAVGTEVETFNEIASEIPFEVDAATTKSFSLGLNVEAPAFVPQEARIPKLSSFAGESSYETAAVSNTEETGIKEGIKHRVALDAQAKEFVSYKHVHTHNELESSSYEEGATAGPTREETGNKGGVKHPVTLDAQAKEFVPYNHVHAHNELESLSYEEGATAGSTREETGITESQPSLNVFATEFVPSSFQSNAAAQSRGRQGPYSAPAMAADRPAPSHPAPGFRPRGQARAQLRQPAQRFPFNHHRVRPARFPGAQQVPTYVMRPCWSSNDR